MLRLLKAVPRFLGTSLRDCLRVATVLIFLPLVFSVLLPAPLARLNLYFDVRETIVAWGKVAHLVIKKPNRLTLKIGHSDSAVGLRDEYELTRSRDGYADTWFAIINPEQEESYNNVWLFIQFDEPNASKVSIKQEDGWTMFKQGHFNFGPISHIRQRFLMQTEQVRIRFSEPGDYPFHYVLYADGYKPAIGARLIHVK